MTKGVLLGVIMTSRNYFLCVAVSLAVGAVGCGGDGCSGSGCSGTGGAGGGAGVPTDVVLQVDDYITGVERPWDIAWLPNGTVLVTERPGTLLVFVDGVDAEPTRIPIEDIVSTGGEGGLMGLEVDPSFADNGYIFLCLASSAGGENDVRIARLTMSRPSATLVEDRTDIVVGMPHNDGSRGRHSGCRPRFGLDGFLWVGTGDAAIGSTPQDEDSLGGKVLRVTRDGAAAPGNTDGRLWYSKGHRNIQGMAFRSDGIGMSAEHGPDVDDEVNALIPGNFGWDPVPGYNESVPMTDLQKFPDAIEAAWSTGSPTLALAGATFLEGSQWGRLDGVLAVATLRAMHVRLLDVDPDGNVSNRARVIEDQGRLRTPRLGPDGLLYITTDRRSDGDRVLRVTPVPAD
jgi:glucose/arabinose dehydrogenase